MSKNKKVKFLLIGLILVEFSNCTSTNEEKNKPTVAISMPDTVSKISYNIDKIYLAYLDSLNNCNNFENFPFFSE